MSQFFEKIATAKGNGDRWVETTAQIMKLLRPKDFDVGASGELVSKKFLYNDQNLPVKHLCHDGILVCENGNSEALETQMDEPITNRLHGSTEAKIISGR